MASLYPLETLHEARVGILCEKEFPEGVQYEAAEELACLAAALTLTSSSRSMRALHPSRPAIPPTIPPTHCLGHGLPPFSRQTRLCVPQFDRR